MILLELYPKKTLRMEWHKDLKNIDYDWDSGRPGEWNTQNDILTIVLIWLMVRWFGWLKWSRMQKNKNILYLDFDLLISIILIILRKCHIHTTTARAEEYVTDCTLIHLFLLLHPHHAPHSTQHTLYIRHKSK